MINFIIMFICLLAGMFIRRRANFAIRDVRPLNTIILWLSLPAVVLTQIPSLIRSGGLPGELLVAAATPWCNFICAAVFVLGLARVFKWSRAFTGALILTTGLGNTSFVGIPVVDSLFGESGVRVAIFIDQLGSFLILGTLGLIVASVCAGRDLSPKTVARRVLFFPPFLAFVLALAWGLSPLPTEGLAVEALKKIGATLVPFALLSVGWQLELDTRTLRRYAVPLVCCLVFRLFVWPLVIVAALGHLSLTMQVTAIEAAMPTMITSAVVAADFELEPELAQLMVGLSIPLSVPTLWFWANALKFI